jgi:hypothetical protein
MAAGSDLEFVAQFRDTVQAYLHAIDAWERKHAQYFRLPSRAHRLTSDLAGEQAAYQQARKALEQLVPRARILYNRYTLRDPFALLLNVQLGARLPAFSGNERTEIARGLVDLLAACANADSPRANTKPVWKRIVDFFV